MPLKHLSINRAGCWFVRSGIQEPGGGVARYYRSDTQTNARVSTEITGYALSTLVYLYERRGDEGALKAALHAGRFLVERAWNAEWETFPFEYSDNGAAPLAFTYFFDCGIIVRGLLSLWRITQDESFLQRAQEAGYSMLRDFGEAFHPVLSLPGKEPLPYTPQWSRSPGCYQLKSALAWHDLFEATGDSKFRSGYVRALASALESKDGFLPAETPEKTMDRLHSYSYFLEGLFPFADRQECREALSSGIERVSGYLREIAPIFARSDVYAQLLRARLFARELAGVRLNEAEATEEAAAIRTFQCDSGDARIDGGFYFGRKGDIMLPFVNPVSTAFCLQAQDLWENRGSHGRLDLRILI